MNVVAVAAGEIELAFALHEQRAAGVEKRGEAAVGIRLDGQAARLPADQRGQRQQLAALIAKRRGLLVPGAVAGRVRAGAP